MTAGATPPGGSGGAYGLSFTGAAVREAVDEGLLLPAPPAWPRVIYQFAPDGDVPADVSIDDHRADVPLATGGHLVIERSPARVTYHRTAGLDAHTFVHPGLAWPAAVFALWHGQVCLHGGAVVGRAGAWGVLGAKTGGKSTLLAHLAAAGVPVLADDQIVVRSGAACAGPRAIDLRATALEHWDGPALVPVRTDVDGGRWRLVLPTVSPEVPLAGVLCLSFGPSHTVEVRPVTGRRRLARLAGALSLHSEPTDPLALLRLADLPVYDVVRPNDWAGFADSVAAISELLDAPAG